MPDETAEPRRDEEAAAQRALHHYAVARFTPAYWALAPAQRHEVQATWLDALRAAAHALHLYQVFPAGHDADLCLWSFLETDTSDAAAGWFAAFARATAPVRAFVDVPLTLWGFTRPSPYSRAQRSAQAIDPRCRERRRYLVIYPFAKTSEWYLKPAAERQTLMHDHMRIGKQYTDVSQLLLYSFGLQDQEFVVVYEMDDLHRFSELVAALRETEARRYTLRDAPLHTCVWHPADDVLALFR